MFIKKPKNPWFPRKKYGIGWGLPTAWQGWLVILAFFVAELVLPHCAFVRTNVAFKLIGEITLALTFIVIVAITGRNS